MNPTPDTDIPVQATSNGRSGQSSGLGNAFVVLGAIAAVAACVPLALLAIVAPKFAELFADFGVALPGVSVLQIRIGLALASPAGVIVLTLLGIVILLAVGLAGRVNRALGLVLFALCCVWFMASIGIMVVGLMLPLVAMIESLQKGGAV